MKIAAITGFSGAGKTTLIESLIRRYVAAGQRVGAIKHTHHKLNEERRGDTAAFGDAGAVPVVFAGDGEAVIFSPDSTRRVRYQSPRDLLQYIDADLVLVEGFKSFDSWPRIELNSERHLTTEEAAAILDRIWLSQ